MKHYLMNDGELEIPDDWQDRTSHIFVDAGKPAPSLNLILTRDELKEGVALADFAEVKVDELTLQLKNFRVLAKRQIEVAGGVALEIEFRWRPETGPVYQRQTYVQRGSQVLIFTATSPRQLDSSQNAQIDSVLASLRFRD